MVFHFFKFKYLFLIILKIKKKKIKQFLTINQIFNCTKKNFSKKTNFFYLKYIIN
jgi:hypothetical protein